MLNPDLSQAAKTLLKDLKDLRPEFDTLNLSFMEAMDQEDQVTAVRALFPKIISTSEKSASAISVAFLSVDWELEGNKPQVLYDVMSGEHEDLPDDLRKEVIDHIVGMSGTEQEMADRFGSDPMFTCIQSLGLETEFTDLINSRDEVAALSAVLQNTQDVPLLLQE